MAEFYTAPDIKQSRGGATVTSGAASTVILGPLDLLQYPTKSFTLYNYGTVTLSGAVIQVNPDHQGCETGRTSGDGSQPGGPNAGLWENHDADTFCSLGSGQVRSKAEASNSLFRWWRIVGTNNQTPSITVSGWNYAASAV